MMPKTLTVVVNDRDYTCTKRDGKVIRMPNVRQITFREDGKVMGKTRSPDYQPGLSHEWPIDEPYAAALWREANAHGLFDGFPTSWREMVAGRIASLPKGR